MAPTFLPLAWPLLWCWTPLSHCLPDIPTLSLTGTSNLAAPKQKQLDSSPLHRHTCPSPPLQAPLPRVGSVTSHWKVPVVSHYTSSETQPFQRPPESCTFTSHCPLSVPLVCLCLSLDPPKAKVLPHRLPSSWCSLPNLRARPGHCSLWYLQSIYHILQYVFLYVSATRLDGKLEAGVGEGERELIMSILITIIFPEP